MIVAVMMVRNEEDIIENILRYNALFVDHFVVENNFSTDGTEEIIRDLINEGMQITLINDEDVNCKYYQDVQTTKLIRYAFDELNADVVIPLDADECLTFTDHSQSIKLMKEYLAKIDQNHFIYAQWRLYMPTSDSAPKSNPILEITDCIEDEEIKLIFYKVIIPRSVYLENPDMSIAKGNHHLIDCTAAGVIDDNLRIAHFPFRSDEQMMGKSIIKWWDRMSIPNWVHGLSYQHEMVFNRIVSGKINPGELADYTMQQYTHMEDSPRDHLESYPLIIEDFIKEKVLSKYREDQKSLVAKLASAGRINSLRMADAEKRIQEDNEQIRQLKDAYLTLQNENEAIIENSRACCQQLEEANDRLNKILNSKYYRIGRRISSLSIQRKAEFYSIDRIAIEKKANNYKIVIVGWYFNVNGKKPEYRLSANQLQRKFSLVIIERKDVVKAYRNYQVKDEIGFQIEAEAKEQHLIDIQLDADGHDLLRMNEEQIQRQLVEKSDISYFVDSCQRDSNDRGKICIRGWAISAEDKEVHIEVLKKGSNDPVEISIKRYCRQDLPFDEEKKKNAGFDITFDLKDERLENYFLVFTDSYGSAMRQIVCI